MSNFPRPLNVPERYAYEQLVRLDALCSMVESLVKHIAEKEGVTVEGNGIEGVEPEPEPEEPEPEVDPEEPEPASAPAQCQGVTAKGNQCKRDAQSDSDYCNVHEPKG